MMMDEAEIHNNNTMMMMNDDNMNTWIIDVELWPKSLECMRGWMLCQNGNEARCSLIIQPDGIWCGIDKTKVYRFPERFIRHVRSENNQFRIGICENNIKIVILVDSEPVCATQIRQLEKWKFYLDDEKEASVLGKDSKNVKLSTPEAHSHKISKREKRRNSISFAGIDLAEIDKQCESPATTMTNKPKVASVQSHDEADLRTMIRQYAAISHSGSGDPRELAKTIFDCCGYELPISTIPYHSKELHSPPKQRVPSKSEMKKLAPIVKTMIQENKNSKSQVEQALQVRIESPAGSRRTIRYVDVKEQGAMPPSTYESKYMNMIGRPCQRPALATISSKSSNVQPPEVPSKKQEPVPLVLEPELASAKLIDTKHDDVPRSAMTSLEEELAKAEAIMHKEFDAALHKFMTLKRELETRYGVENITMNAPRSVEKKASKQSSRRKSICIDDMISRLELDV